MVTAEARRLETYSRLERRFALSYQSRDIQDWGRFLTKREQESRSREQWEETG